MDRLRIAPNNLICGSAAQGPRELRNPGCQRAPDGPNEIMVSTSSIVVPERTTQLAASESQALPLPGIAQHGQSSASQLIDFSNVMIEFEERYPTEPEALVERGYSIRSKTSWQEVLGVLDDAATEYATKKGFKGALKKTKEFIENKSDTFQRVSSLVPDVDYAKPILGTLTFLLQAFEQTGKVRDEVRIGIEKLQTKFGLVEDYIAMYSTNKKVVDAVTTLYITILKAVEEVIGYYTQHMFIKGLKAMWDGKNYEKSLLECLENISKDGNELIHQADTAHKQDTHEMAGNVNKISITVNAIEDLVKSANSAVRNMINDGLRAIEVKYEKERARHEEDKKFLQRQIERQDAENKELKELFYQAITPEPMQIASPAIVMQQDLLDFLDSADIDTNDIEYVASRRELIIAGGQNRTEQIMKSSQLREWLVQAESKELLIHGHSEPERISPISFFCALLMRNLRDVPQFKSVAFFCGCHPYDDFGGARPMIMSLLTQLLQQQHFDLGFIDHELAHQMDGGDIRAFCFVFGQLVRQVKSMESVFCVIDGINFYEGLEEELLQDTAYVLRYLLDLTRDRGVTFKILVTSPSITIDTRLAIEDEDYLSLPRRDAKALGYSDLRFQRQWHEGFEAEQH
ncbi:hypothetical protein PGQ11_005571 [Apiospora arundinis]|uniref:Fungal STAND N-terminal Goodbye domain-containing protein n=1 Tax=Apiospora arundinis TaxID=335852 RepID=A0ABR2JBN7_9PEZI